MKVGSPGDILRTGQCCLCDSSTWRKVNLKLQGDRPCVTAFHLFTEKILLHHKNSQNSSFPGQTDWRAPSSGAQPCWRHTLSEAQLAGKVGGCSSKDHQPHTSCGVQLGGLEPQNRLSGGIWAVTGFSEAQQVYF